MISGYTEASVILSNNIITISSPTNQGAQVIGSTSNSFDLTNYKYAYIVGRQTTSSSYGKINIGFSATKSNNYKVSLSHSNGEGNTGTHNFGGLLDISSLSGNYYICFDIPKHGYSSSASIYLIILK